VEAAVSGAPGGLPSDIQRELEQRIEEFVADITELARRAAMEALAGALDQQLGGGGGASIRRRRGEKRSAQQLADAQDRLLDYIRDNPGQRMEEIAREFGANTRDLTLPLRKLVASHLVRTEGQKRATCYYPAAAGYKPKQRASKKGGRKRKG
jgi:hypothetical protein